jgi:tetratricopeptide (TPR) repeat protein
MAEAQPPKRLGDFELLREIGRGGMGIVYDARQVSLNRRVALKILPPGLGLTAQAVRRFEREAQAAAKLHHTNIVPVHAIGEEDGCHYYAMELIEGQPLSDVLRDLGGSGSNPVMDATVTMMGGTEDNAGVAADTGRTETRPGTSGITSLSDSSSGSRQWFDAVAKLVAEVAEALEYAHGRGVTHRDIKPANLMLSDAGRLCITDFGLARVAQEPGMTVSGSLMGTPAYMSPEQITAGRVKLDHRTDVYSLGAVLYEMLTYRRPFPGESREEILTGILTKDPRPPRRFNPRIPVDLETICLKAMEKDPDRRYPTAGEMAADLKRYAERGLITARRAGLLRRAAKAMRRHPVAAVSSVAAVIILVLGMLAWQLAGRRSEEAALRAVSEARFFMSQGDHREALKTVDTVLEAAPGLSEARLMRAHLLIKLSRGQEAVDEARVLLEDDPDDWQGHLILGIAAKYRTDLSAEEHLQAVEEAAPETAEAYYLRGLIEEDDRRAIELLDRSLQLEPAGADAMQERCSRHIDLKNFQAALLDGERLTALRPRSALGRRMIGEIHHALHDSDRALAELEEAIRFDPADPSSLVSRMKVFRDLGRMDQALADVSRAIELRPDAPWLYMIRSGIHTDLRQFDRAVADAEKSLQLTENSPGAYWALGNALGGMGDTEGFDALVDDLFSRSAGWQNDERRATAARLQAWARQRQDDLEGALAAWDLAIELRPEDPALHGHRAAFLEITGDRERFEAACDRLEALRPTELDQWVRLVEYLRFTCERVDASVAASSTMITLAPGWADPYAWRAYMYHLQNRYDETLADYARAIELAPRWAKLYEWRGDAYRDMERFEDALRDYTRFFELGSEDMWVRYNRAMILARLGREEEAFRDVDLNVQRLPDDARSYLTRADLHWHLGRAEEALADLVRAIEAEPGNVLAHQMHAVAALEHSRSCDDAARNLQALDELADGEIHWYHTAFNNVQNLVRFCPDLFEPARALELARKVVELQPLKADYQETYGLALYRNGQFSEARTALQRSLDLQYKPDPGTLAYLAMTLWQLGHRDEALALYEQARPRFAAWPHWFLWRDIRQEAADLLGVQP